MAYSSNKILKLLELIKGLVYVLLLRIQKEKTIHYESIKPARWFKHLETRYYYDKVINRCVKIKCEILTQNSIKKIVKYKYIERANDIWRNNTNNLLVIYEYLDSNFIMNNEVVVTYKNYSSCVNQCKFYI